MNFRNRIDRLFRAAGGIGRMVGGWRTTFTNPQDPLPPNATAADRRLHAELRAMENDTLPPPESAGDPSP